MTSRLSPADRRLLRTVAENGGAEPPRDIPGGRKLYAPVLKVMRRLETKGWLESDFDGLGADFFTITPAGAAAAGITIEEDA